MEFIAGGGGRPVAGAGHSLRPRGYPNANHGADTDTNLNTHEGGCPDGDTHSNSYPANAYTHSYSEAGRDSSTHGHSDANQASYCDTDTDGDTRANCHTNQGCTDGYPDPDSYYHPNTTCGQAWRDVDHGGQ